MNELWVARDMDPSGGVFVFPVKPFLDRWLWRTRTGWICGLPGAAFPDLRPGECKRFVMAEETSE